MAKVARAGGRRRQWLPLFAVGILLGGAAVVGLSPDAQVPAPRPARTSTAPSTSPVAAYAAAVDRVELTVEQDAAQEEQVAPAPSGPTLVVKARFRVRPAGAEAEGDLFAHGGNVVTVAADDGPITGADQGSKLRLPVGARKARFVAKGYRDVERDVPEPQSGCVDFGDVVFEPDAVVRVRLVGAPAEGAVRFTVGRSSDGSDCFAQSIVSLLGGIAEATLPVPSANHLVILALPQPSAEGSIWFAVQPHKLLLQRGETAMVELRARTGVSVTVAVRGPSALLARSLYVGLLRDDGNGQFPYDQDTPRLRLDAEGCARFLVSPGRCQPVLLVEGRTVGLRATDGSGLVQDLTHGAVLDVEPIEPLAGVVVRERGKPVPSALSLRGPIGAARDHDFGECHAWTAAKVAAAPSLWYWTEGAGSRVCAQADLRLDGDLAWIEVARGAALARLDVDAELPKASQHALRIVAEPLQGGQPVDFGNRPPFSRLLVPGGYCVRWICNGAHGPVIDACLTMAPGELRRLRAQAPELQDWTARVLDLALLGEQSWACSALVDGQWAAGAANRDGTLPFQLPMSPVTDMPAELYLHVLKMRLPARITAIDVGNHTISIGHDLTAMDIAHVVSRGLGSGERQLWLCSALAETRFCAGLGPAIDVPLLSGSVRAGCLTEQIDGHRQVTNWFTLHHGVQQVLVEPLGHWATVRLATPGVKASVLVEGHAGMDPFQVGQLTQPGELAVFVADGTVAVHVDLQPGQRQSFAPELAEMVVR